MKAEYARLVIENKRLRDRVDELHRQLQATRTIAALPVPEMRP